jgi:hypothetical protein
MKKLLTLLFAAGIVTAASAQSGHRQGYDNRSSNSYQTSPYSNQYSYGNEYNSHSQWNDRRDHDWIDRDRRQAARERYEMMMRRNRARYYDKRSYDRNPYYGSGYSNKSSFRLSIGF